MLTGIEENRGCGSVFVPQEVTFVGGYALTFVGMDVCVRRLFLRQRSFMVGAFVAHAKNYLHHALALCLCVVCAAGFLRYFSFKGGGCFLEFMCQRAFFLGILLENMRGESAHTDTVSSWLSSSLVGCGFLFVAHGVHQVGLVYGFAVAFLFIPYVDALLYRTRFEGRASTSVLVRGVVPAFQASGAWLWVCAFHLVPIVGVAYIFVGAVVSHMLPAARTWWQLLRSFCFFVCAVGCAMVAVSAFYTGDTLLF